jgi:hypothetical protein
MANLPVFSNIRSWWDRLQSIQSGRLGTLVGGSSYVNGTYYNVPSINQTGASTERTRPVNVTVAGNTVTSVTLVSAAAKDMLLAIQSRSASLILAGAGVWIHHQGS